MSAETATESKEAFKSARPVEQVPTAAEINAMVNNGEAAEPVAEQPLQAPESRIANLLHKGADILEGAAIKRQTKVDQDFAYGTYAENISATKGRERQERSQDHRRGRQRPGRRHRPGGQRRQGQWQPDRS